MAQLPKGITEMVRYATMYEWDDREKRHMLSPRIMISDSETVTPMSDLLYCLPVAGEIDFPWVSLASISGSLPFESGCLL